MFEIKFFWALLSKLPISNIRPRRCYVTNVTSLMLPLGSGTFYIRPNVSVRVRLHCLYYGHINTSLPPYCTCATRKAESRTPPSASSVTVCRLMCTVSESTSDKYAREGIKSNIECSSENLATQVERYFSINESFVSEDEQQILLKEIEKHFKGLRYEYDHWDEAIHGYRETEKSRWSSETQTILQRVRQAAFKPGASQLPLVHVLDLAENGYIKPHVDSIKFCGPTIAGISLISPSIMKLVKENDHSQWVKVLLRPGSLYIMRDKLRFEYTHEILKDNESFINGEKIKRGRRVSVMFRDQPLMSQD